MVWMCAGSLRRRFRRHHRVGDGRDQSLRQLVFVCQDLRHGWGRGVDLSCRGVSRRRRFWESSWTRPTTRFRQGRRRWGRWLRRRVRRTRATTAAVMRRSWRRPRRSLNLFKFRLLRRLGPTDMQSVVTVRVRGITCIVDSGFTGAGLLRYSRLVLLIPLAEPRHRLRRLRQLFARPRRPRPRHRRHQLPRACPQLQHLGGPFRLLDPGTTCVDGSRAYGLVVRRRLHPLGVPSRPVRRLFRCRL